MRVKMRSGIALILLLCGVAGLPAQGLRISGASTLQDLVEEASKAYAQRGGAVAAVRGGGSGQGVKDSLAGISDMGMVSRALSDSEKASLRHTTIGYDALVFIVNVDNPLKDIDLGQVRALFSGKAELWSALGAGRGTVVPINKEIGRSTLELFEGYSGLAHPGRGKEGPAGSIALGHEIGSNLEMATIVGGIPEAVGYLSYGTAAELMSKGMPIKILWLDGVEPSADSIMDGSYPIIRELNMVYRDDAPETSAFLAFLLGKEGRALVESFGFMASAGRSGGE